MGEAVSGRGTCSVLVDVGVLDSRHRSTNQNHENGTGEGPLDVSDGTDGVVDTGRGGKRFGEDQTKVLPVGIVHHADVDNAEDGIHEEHALGIVPPKEGADGFLSSSSVFLDLVRRFGRPSGWPGPGTAPGWRPSQG